MGIVGVDEVEARAALLNPTLEQGHPAPTSSRSATLAWRLHLPNFRRRNDKEVDILTGRPTHMEGIFILGCSTWFRIRPSPSPTAAANSRHISSPPSPRRFGRPPARISPPQRESGVHSLQGEATQHPDEALIPDDEEDWMDILSGPPLKMNIDPDLLATTPGNTSQQGTIDDDLPTPPTCLGKDVFGLERLQM
ncbi:uncharacterized protein [Palaemon carinicauda]|uniref:uncharacterized protein n=1 Tax=Palaemon carinicauda TaxID=392227 RepID=UPI0035B627BF